MKQIIEITRDNLDQIAKGLAASINRLGFRKNGKEMVASQAIRVLAERQGMNEHQFIKSLKSKPKADPKVQECDDTVPAYFGQAIRLMTSLGFSVCESDFGKPYWTYADEGSNDFEHDIAAWADAWTTVVRTTKDARMLSDAAWDAMTLAEKMAAVMEVYPSVPGEEHSVSVAQATEPTMTPLELRWGHEHSWYGRDEWREDVTRGITHLSYWMWVQQSIERNGGDEEHCSDCGKPLDGESWDGKCGDCADREEAEDDLQDEAASLGINLADAQFWVSRHFRKDFAAAPLDQRIDWLHSYRVHNGLTPEGSLEISRADVQATRQVADAAFEAYDFGENLTVVDHEGWEWCSGDSILTKKVFLEDLQAPDEPSRLVKFVVNVVNGVVTDISVSS